jgi:radical SAM superfamily enzyme YgiQ (UPF0313 family)
MACEAVDFILRGEGEVSMPQLAKAIKTGDSIKSIPGIVYRRADGTLRVSPPTTMVDPDRYPLPAMHLLKHDFYKREKSACTVITASRGCPMKCSYCCIGSGSVVTYRRRSVNRIVAEIEHAVAQFNVGFIDFEDENLSLEKKWFLTLLRELKTRIKRPGLELRAMNGLFPPSLDDEIVYAMRQAGFKILNLSLGSTCRPQLKKFCRPDVRDAFEKALGLAEKYGLKAVGYVIAGAPDQRAADSVADLLYLASHRVLAGVSIFYPAPGSSDFDLCKEFGILPDGFSLMRSSTLPLSHTTTRIESVTLMRLGRILNFTKSLVDQGLNIPKPLPFCKDAILNNMDRTETGQQLLRWFLHDGIIRGVTQSGEIYEHKTSRKLTQMFIEALKSIRIKGYETSQTG